VLISVRREGETQGHNLEVPAEVPAEQLSDMLARALGWERTRSGQPAGYAIVKESSGQIVRGHETLADVGVWDGAGLVLRPKAGAPEKVLRPAVLESSTQRRYQLIYPKMRIGRSQADAADSDAQLDLIDLRDEPEGQTVSRNHALAVYTNGDWALIPFGKTENPTLVNDRPIDPDRPYQLLDGARVQLGGVRLSFQLGAS
jgi:hypothetical protein